MQSNNYRMLGKSPRKCHFWSHASTEVAGCRWCSRRRDEVSSKSISHSEDVCVPLVLKHRPCRRGLAAICWDTSS